MGASPNESAASTLLVDEAFATEDERFVDLVRTVGAPKYLAALADRWKQDPRPWAREQIFTYLAQPLDRPGHETVVKRLFKQAEANRDHALMAAFLVVFDRLIRRQRRMRYRWDFQTRQTWREEELRTPRNQIPRAAERVREGINPFTGEKTVFRVKLRIPKGGRLFSSRTRSYLRRRAWRYFRRLGFMRPAEYPAAIAVALAKYIDDDVARGENMLDNWSLMNVAFRYSPVLQFTPASARLADGRSLGELSAAPRFEALWKQAESAAELLKLVVHANSRLVRVWSMQLLKQHHSASVQAISADQLLELLDHPDDEVQQFGAGLLESLTAAGSWPLATWLRLLETRSPAALAIICDAMRLHVRPERLDVPQCVALVCARATPVARLGLSCLEGRPLTDERERQWLVRLAAARCEAVGADVAKLALAVLGTADVYRTDAVVAFFDSLNAEIRRGAWNWLTPKSTGFNDAALWSRLLESPYDDVRLRLVDELDRRMLETNETSGLVRQDLAPVWAAVLLGVHRGGRSKLKALRQVSQAIAREPARAEALIPVLAVAIRSVRPAEARAGLAAILSAVAARPALEELLARHLPELRLAAQEGAA